MQPPPERAGLIRTGGELLGVLPYTVRWAQVGPNRRNCSGGRAWTGGDRQGLSCSGQLARGKERPVSTTASNELEHHMFPVVRYSQVGEGVAGPIAVAGSSFTFGEGTLVTCWHCVKQPLGTDEVYGIAVRRGGIGSPYEFCSIDNLERDRNGADIALGHIDWMPGRGLTLANDPVQWGERVETYGYPFPLAVPDQMYPGYKALHVYSRFLRGYVTRLARDENERPVIDLDMLCPPGLSGAPVIREDRRDVIGVIFEEQTTTMYERTVIFGRAHHLDVLRSARAAVTEDRSLIEHLQQTD